MKKRTIFSCLIAVFQFAPFWIQAQWHAVRFDSSNTFWKVFTVSSQTAFVSGVEPFGSETFLLRTNDGGGTWDSIALNTIADTFQVRSLFFIDTDHGFVGGTKNNHQVLLKTIDNGNTFTEITPDSLLINGIVSIHFTDAQNGFVTNRNNLYQTSNAGNSWTTNAFPGATIWDIKFYDSNNGYACGANGEGIVLKTNDAGASWDTVFSWVHPFLFWSDIGKMDFINPDTGFSFLRNTNILFKTENGGISWDTIVVDSAVYIADFDFTSIDTGHVLSLEGKIFVTTDGGITWTMEYATAWGLYGPLVNLHSFSFFEQTGFVAGSNGLIKKYTANQSTFVYGDKTSLVRIYPNPFATEAILEITDLKLIENAELHILDLSGKKVHQQPLRSNKESLNLHLPAGLYIYSVFGNHEVIYTGKLIVQ